MQKIFKMDVFVCVALTPLVFDLIVRMTASSWVRAPKQIADLNKFESTDLIENMLDYAHVNQ